MIRDSDARKAIVEIGRRLYQKNLIAAGDGNISVKVAPDRILVTASGTHKGFLAPEDLVTVDLAGRAIAPRGPRPSSELLMHTLCYAERAECGAVVHAHPPMAVALALAGVPLTDCVLSEACLALGEVPTAPYTTPTTDEVPRVLRDYVRRANAIVMARHGALTLGRSLDEAWRRMETLEHTARTIIAARALGPVTALPPGDARKLDAVANSFGIERPQPEGSNDTEPDDDAAAVERIVTEVMRRLRPPRPAR